MSTRSDFLVFLSAVSEALVFLVFVSVLPPDAWAKPMAESIERANSTARMRTFLRNIRNLLPDCSTASLQTMSLGAGKRLVKGQGRVEVIRRKRKGRRNESRFRPAEIFVLPGFVSYG